MIVGKQINSLQRLIEITINDRKSIFVKDRFNSFQCHSWKFIANLNLKTIIKMINDDILFECVRND